MEEKIIQEEPKRPKSSQKLQEEFKTLEQDWKSFTQSSSKVNKPLQKLTRTEDCGSVFRRVLEYSSPRSMMSSLQNPTERVQVSSPFSSPVTVNVSGKVWRVRENELAKEESRRQHKQAIESGELKGRRLFEEGFEFYNEIDPIESVLGSVCGQFEEKEGEKRVPCFGSLEEIGKEVGVSGNILNDRSVSLEKTEEIESTCSSICSEYGEGKTGEEEQGMLCFKKERNGNGGRLVLFVKLLCFLIVIVAFFLGMFLGLRELGKEECYVMIPT